MTIINVAPIPAGQGRRRRRRPPLTGDTLPFFLLQRVRPPSPLPRAINIPAAGAAVASPTADETRRRRRQSPPKGSPTRTQLRESSLFSFLLLRARYARSWSSAVARHAAPASRLPA